MSDASKVMKECYGIPVPLSKSRFSGFYLTSSHSKGQFWFWLWFKIEMFALNIAGGWTIVNYTRWCGHVQ